MVTKEEIHAEDEASATTRSNGLTNKNNNSNNGGGGGGEKEDDVDDDDSSYVWYFAIGSMMHPTQCRLRGFIPHNNFEESQAAELLDYELQFFGPMGVSEAKAAPGKSMHGVLHHVTLEQMKQLDKIEQGYIRQDGKAIPYGKKVQEEEDQDPIAVTVYSRPPRGHDAELRVVNDEEDAPPSERYLDLLIAGAKYWNIKEEYIQMLQQHDFVPRKPVSEFLTLPSVPKEEWNVYETIPTSEQNGEDSIGNNNNNNNNNKDGPPPNLYCTLNGKIVKYSFPTSDLLMYQITKHSIECHGPHIELQLTKQLYDVKYGAPNSLGEVTKEHSEYLEDFLVTVLSKLPSGLEYVKTIGTYDKQTWKAPA